MAFEVDFDENPTELYTSICEGEWDTASSLVKEHPEDASTWVVRYDTEDPDVILWRFLPLHSACARQPNETLIETLLLAYPEAASAKDDQGFLPLHYACGNRANDAVINMLLIVYPQAAGFQDPYGGKLPLHHLCQWGAHSVGVVYMLLAVYPEAIHIKENTGYTPVDLAKAANYPGRNVVITALKQCTIAAKMRPVEAAHRITHPKMDITREFETIEDQEEAIAELLEEFENIRNERDELEVNLDEEKSTEKQRQDEGKVVTLNNELSCVQAELDSIRERYHQLEVDQTIDLDDIKSHLNEIKLMKVVKENMVKECDTLDEKLALKKKMNEDNTEKLKNHVVETKSGLELKENRINKLEDTAQTIESELEDLKDGMKDATIDIRESRESKFVCDKIGLMNNALQSLQVRFSLVKEMNEDQDKMFMATIAEREQKILEIAQLEEQLRFSTSEEHQKLINELVGQQEETNRILQMMC